MTRYSKGVRDVAAFYNVPESVVHACDKYQEAHDNEHPDFIRHYLASLGVLPVGIDALFACMGTSFMTWGHELPEERAAQALCCFLEGDAPFEELLARLPLTHAAHSNLLRLAEAVAPLAGGNKDLAETLAIEVHCRQHERVDGIGAGATRAQLEAHPAFLQHIAWHQNRMDIYPGGREAYRVRHEQYWGERRRTGPTQ